MVNVVQSYIEKFLCFMCSVGFFNVILASFHVFQEVFHTEIDTN